MEDKIEKRLRKLLALAERGVGGEKDNAQRMLENLLKKHGMSLSDITDEATETYWFKYKGKIERKLLSQIIVTVMNNRDIDFWKSSIKRQTIGIIATKQQMLEIELMFNSYSRAFIDEVETLCTAFIQKNNIFPAYDDGEAEDDKKDSPEEKARIWKIMNMMQGMEKIEIRKAITHSN